MNDASNWLVHDHKKYDDALDQCEMAADVGEWDKAKSLFREFAEDLKLHMQMEDEVLYPLFLEEKGDPEGKIGHLSSEHDYLVHLVNGLAYIIRNNDFEHFLDSLQPLHKAMKVHNEHEERVFLDMSNESILMRRDEIMQKLDAMHDHKSDRGWKF